MTWRARSRTGPFPKEAAVAAGRPHPTSSNSRVSDASPSGGPIRWVEGRQIAMIDVAPQAAQVPHNFEAKVVSWAELVADGLDFLCHPSNVRVRNLRLTDQVHVVTNRADWSSGCDYFRHETRYFAPAHSKASLMDLQLIMPQPEGAGKREPLDSCRNENQT